MRWILVDVFKNTIHYSLPDAGRHISNIPDEFMYNLYTIQL